MIYPQALKFLGKRVYVILDDTSVVYGTLLRVDGVLAKITSERDDQEISSHIKHIYPC